MGPFRCDFSAVRWRAVPERRVKNVERIPNIGPYIVACMDDELLQLCKSKGIPAFYARSADIIGDRGNLGTAHGQKQQTIGADRYGPLSRNGL
jgi:hypothetical protein